MEEKILEELNTEAETTEEEELDLSTIGDLTEDDEYEEDYGALAGVAGVSYIAGILTDHVWKTYIKPKVTPVIEAGKAKLVSMLTKAPEKETETTETTEVIDVEVEEVSEEEIEAKVEELKNKKNKK